MDSAHQNGVLAQEQHRAPLSVEHGAGQPDIRRPLVTPRRVVLVVLGTAAVGTVAQVVASLGTFVGGIVLVVITAMCIVALLVKHQRQVWEEAAAEQRRRELLQRLDAEQAEEQQAARLDDTAVLQRPHTDLRPVPATEEHIFEVHPALPLTPDDLRQKQIEAGARADKWTTEQILEREG